MTAATLTRAQAMALRAIVGAVVQAVAEAGPTGAPSGVLYAALTAHGCSLSQYQSLMGALVRNGTLRADGDVYFIGEDESHAEQYLA